MKKIIILLYMISGMFFSIHAKDTFTALFSQSQINFNPLYTFTSTEAQIYTALYEGLLSYHPQTLEPLPAAAESWEVSEDQLIYRFKLRIDLVYSNGDPIIADHFKESWIELMSPQNKTEYASLLDIIKNGAEFRKGEVGENELGIRVESDRILVIELKHQAPYLLKVLCHHSLAPVHPSLIDKKNWNNEEIIVNGPYVFTERSNESFELEKNDNYWDKENVSIQNLSILFSDDSEQNTLNFNRDSIDWLTESFDIESLNMAETIVLNPLFSTTYLYFSNKNKPWGNKNVRKALALLLPWDKIRSSQLIPGSTLIPSIPYYPEAVSITESNKDEALRLLKEEGFEKGRGLPPIILKLPESLSMSSIGEIMKKSWQEFLNVEVSIETESFPGYFESMKNGNYTIGSLTWIGDFADPMTFLQMWLSSSSLNDAAYYNNDYDMIIDDSADKDFNERYQRMSDAESMLLDTAQVMPIGHSPALNIIDLRFIEGWYPNVLDIHPFKYLKFKTGYIIPGTI